MLVNTTQTAGGKVLSAAAKKQQEADEAKANDALLLGPEKALSLRDRSVIYLSTRAERRQFVVRGIMASRSPVKQNHLEWLVPEDIASRFAVHHHVVTGRIQRYSPKGKPGPPASEK